MSNQQIKSKLKEAYKKFFRKMKIDGQTGKLLSKTNLKFPTYPYIGSDYGKCKNILIVGTDIGKDENVNGIQTFKERNASIEGKDLAEHNPHIAGTYFTALYF